MELTATVILILFVASIAASFVQRVSGFGFGIFIMTILPFFLPYGSATTLSGMLALSQSFYVAVKMRKYIVWKRVLPMLAIFLLISYFCIGVVASSDTLLLMHILGGVLVLLSLYFLFFSERIRLKPSVSMQLAMGGIGGVMGGFFGMQGPPAVLYYVQSEPDKNYYAAQTQLFFVSGNIFMTFVRGYNGFLTQDVLKLYVICIGAVAIGTFLGNLVFKKISSEILKKIVYAYMALAGIVFMLK